jgi:hypothetical protein
MRYGRQGIQPVAIFRDLAGRRSSKDARVHERPRLLASGAAIGSRCQVSSDATACHLNPGRFDPTVSSSFAETDQP